MAEQANWYVAHTYSGYENKVATDLMTMVENRHLQDLICDVKVPTETRIEEVFDKRGNVKKVPSGFFAKLLSELQNKFLYISYFAILPLRRVIGRERKP